MSSSLHKRKHLKNPNHVSIEALVDPRKGRLTTSGTGSLNNFSNTTVKLVARSVQTSVMVRKRFREAKTGIEWLKSVNYDKYLTKVGFGKEDHYFWKQASKTLFYTCAILGAGWLFNETSPLGWYTFKPRPKEEYEMAHLYDRRNFPYPGDKEAMEEFVTKGGMIGTSIGPKGIVDLDKNSFDYKQDLKDRKFEQEALKMWIRMRNEVITELQEKGYDVE